MSNTIATHLSPVWSSDSVVFADLSQHGLEERLEQFWVKKVSKNVFEIRCIPFFTYGIALADTVEVDEEFRVQRVVSRGGHGTLRIAVSDFENSEMIHSILRDWIKHTGLLHEWFSDGYLSVDITSSVDLEAVMKPLQKLSESGRIAVEVDNG